jgi:hypothetical protein
VLDLHGGPGDGVERCGAGGDEPLGDVAGDVVQVAVGQIAEGAA